MLYNDEQTTQLLTRFYQQLKNVPHDPHTTRLQVSSEGREAVIEFPDQVIDLLLKTLEEKLVEADLEVSATHAAELLRVSRPYLLKLLEEGKIPFHKVGSQQRMQLADVMAYREKIDTERNLAFDELVKLSEELGLYDL